MLVIELGSYTWILCQIVARLQTPQDSDAKLDACEQSKTIQQTQPEFKVNNEKGNLVSSAWFGNGY